MQNDFLDSWWVSPAVFIRVSNSENKILWVPKHLRYFVPLISSSSSNLRLFHAFHGINPCWLRSFLSFTFLCVWFFSCPEWWTKKNPSLVSLHDHHEYRGKISYLKLCIRWSSSDREWQSFSTKGRGLLLPQDSSWISWGYHVLWSLTFYYMMLVLYFLSSSSP